MIQTNGNPINLREMKGNWGTIVRKLYYIFWSDNQLIIRLRQRNNKRINIEQCVWEFKQSKNIFPRFACHFLIICTNSEKRTMEKRKESFFMISMLLVMIIYKEKCSKIGYIWPFSCSWKIIGNEKDKNF